MSGSSPDSGVQSVYDFWLGLIPQFFAQLGAATSAGEGTGAGPAASLSFPVDQVARAATMTQEALQRLAQAYAPMLQATGAPGLLGQWAAAMPFFPASEAPAEPAATPATGMPGMFGPWAAAMMPFLPGARAAAEEAPATSSAPGLFNPWAAAMPFLPGLQPASAQAAADASGAAGMPGAWIAALPFMAGGAASAGQALQGAASLGMAPYQAMQQAWRDAAAQMAGGTAQAFGSAFDRTFGALTDALGFGPVRKLQSAWQELLSAGMAQNESRTKYAMLVQSAFTAGLERLFARLAQMAEAGERVDSVLALLRLWAVNTEAAVHEVLQSEEGLAATAAIARAGITYRRKLQHVAAILADGLDMATRRDLDEAFREIQELKREIRALRPPARSEATPARPRAGNGRRTSK